MTRTTATMLDDVLRVGIQVLLWLWVAINLATVAWVVLTSLKTTREIFDDPFGLPAAPMWENYVTAWNVAGFGGAAASSIVIVSISAVLIVAISAPAAYVLARILGRRSERLLTYFAFGMGIPFQLVLIPLFLFSHELDTFMVDWITGWWDDRITLCLIYVALSLPFSVFVLASFFRSLPHELEEAAALDGASPGAAFWRIMFPLARPGLVTVLVLNVVSLWNETLLMLVLVTDPAQRTLPGALLNLYNAMQYTSNWGGLFAGVVILVMPMILLYMWVGRRIISGMTQGIGK
ncbi:MAG: carbohydrate ABC transporter permease [Arachnia sp.]